MLSTSPAYRTDRSPPFLASCGAVLFCAGFSEAESSSPPQPTTPTASTAATANMARQCAASLIWTYPPLRDGAGVSHPGSPPVAAQRNGRCAVPVGLAHRAVSRLRLEHHVLGSLPQHCPSQLAQ